MSCSKCGVLIKKQDKSYSFSVQYHTKQPSCVWIFPCCYCWLKLCFLIRNMSILTKEERWRDSTLRVVTQAFYFRVRVSCLPTSWLAFRRIRGCADRRTVSACDCEIIAVNIFLLLTIRCVFLLSISNKKRKWRASRIHMFVATQCLVAPRR